jgi:anti-anti-sigma factor
VSELADVTVDLVDGVHVARVRGEIDLSNAEGLLEVVLEPAVSRPGPGVVVDLSQTTYIDSAGIRELFELRERLEALGQRVRVVVPEDATITRVLELANADASLDIDATLPQALKALA